MGAMAAGLRLLLPGHSSREVFYGMQRGGPSASTAEEQGHGVSSQTRGAKLAKDTALLCSAASFAF